MSRASRKRVLNTKDRINNYIISSQALQLDDPLPQDLNCDALNHRLESTMFHQIRLDRQIAALKDNISAWRTQLNEETELDDYNLNADGPDGFEAVISSADELSAELESRRAILQRRIDTITQNERAPVPPPPPANAPVVGHLNPNSRVKLPEIKLMNFSGDMRKWLEFWDNFQSCIDNEPSLQKVQKFAYLKGVLFGPAADIISNLPITDANYELAVSLLKKRFGDKENQLAILYAEWNHLPIATSRPSDLRKLHDTAEKILRQLETLGDSLTNSNLAVQELKRKIPYVIMIDFEKERNYQFQWTTDRLLQHLDRYLKIRESVQQEQFRPPPEKRYETTVSKEFSYQKDTSNTNVVNSSALMSDVKQKPSSSGGRVNFSNPCIFCGGNHYNEDCLKFKTSADRKQKLMSEHRCFICFASNHLLPQCPKKETSKCHHCKKSNHNRALCMQKFPVTASENHTSQTNVMVNSNLNLKSENYSPLLTATVTIRKPESNEFLTCKLVLDSASQKSFGLNSIAENLDLPTHGTQGLSISTFGAANQKFLTSNFSDVEMFLKDGSAKRVTLNFVPKIVHSMRREKLCEADLNYLKNLNSRNLADNMPTKSEIFHPDILIGSDYFWDFFDHNEKKALPSGLLLISSKLGLLLAGKTVLQNSESLPQSVCISALSVDPKIKSDKIVESMIQNMTTPNSEMFWSLEVMGITDSFNKPEDDSVLTKFNSELTFENSRYQVKWPWKQENPELSDNFGLSLGRFRSLSKRLASDSNLLKKYSEIIADQKAAGITEEISEKLKPHHLVHYLPHHPVITPLKSTTKVRIVFDASAKLSANHNSLNDCLYCGPNFIPDLCGMLIRFRIPKIAIVSDIEKAFLQIGLQMPDRDVTRFLWYKDPKTPEIKPDLKNLAVYRFCRVPFGVISSPFLLEAVLKRHLQSKSTDLALEIEKNLYMDNVIISANNFQEAFKKYKQAKDLFNEASLNLREWTSNNSEFNANLPENDQAKGESLKILGMNWNLNSDKIGNKIPEIAENQTLTKRTVLKTVASVFDPLGFWTPATFFGKVFFQKLWSENLNWDTTLPKAFEEKWAFAINAIKPIQNHTIPRMFVHPAAKLYQLVGFCDASENCYGCVIYLISKSENDVCSNLLLSKMRLKPIKSKSKQKNDFLTIPRLELMAVLVGTRLEKFVREHLTFPLQKSVLFTDSQCVLCWVDSKKPLSAFVQNRVTEIRKATNTEFRFVASEQNPADLLTRGKTADELAATEFWWKGPNWITKPKEKWPTFNYSSEIQTNQIANNSVVVNAAAKLPILIETNLLNIDCSRFATLKKLLRVTVFCLRFLKKLRPQIKQLETVKLTGEIIGPEIDTAKKLWYSNLQKLHYPKLFSDEPDNQTIKLKNQLGLFQDSDSIFRCAGRFQNSKYFLLSPHPILLSRDHRFTELLISDCHRKIKHGRTNHTLATLRKEVWIPRGRSTVKKVLEKCLICKKFNGGPFRLPQFPPFPKVRIEEAPPFTYVGLDYFGPILVKSERITKKVWVCLYTCLVVRAIHLEVVNDMTTSEFLGSFKRFVCRRKCPKTVISDNAKQFKMANSVLTESLENVKRDPEISSYFADMLISWYFIPEFSPWQGGVYERMVGVVKSALRKVIGKRMLQLSQLQTTLCEIESMTNSRPITYLSVEPSDQPALCPSDFLNQGNSAMMPDFVSASLSDDDYQPNVKTTQTTLKNLWKKQSLILNDYWNLWRDLYLNLLRERPDFQHPSKKTQVNRSPVLGEVVIIKEEKMPRGLWKIGKVVKLNSSQDKEIRSAQIQLANKRIVTRPLSLLYSLEIFSTTEPLEKPETNNNSTQVQQLPRPKRDAALKCQQRIREMLHDNVLLIQAARVS